MKTKINIPTNRLELREFIPDDFTTFLQYRSDAELCRYQNFMVNTEEEVIKFYEEQKHIILNQSKEWKQIAIVYNKELIGDCAFKCNENDSRVAEIGITLRREFHGQGFAKEALHALFTYVFNHIDLHKIMAIVDIRNIASLTLFTNLGFNKEAHFRKHYWDNIDNDWFDEIHYGLLKSDFIK